MNFLSIVKIVSIPFPIPGCPLCLLRFPQHYTVRELTESLPPPPIPKGCGGAFPKEEAAKAWQATSRVPLKAWARAVRCCGDLVTTFPLPPTHFPGFLGLLLRHRTVTLPDVAAASGPSRAHVPPTTASASAPQTPFLLPRPAGRPPARPPIPGPGEGRERRREEEGRPPLPHRQKGGRGEAGWGRPGRGRKGPAARGRDGGVR